MIVLSSTSNSHSFENIIQHQKLISQNILSSERYSNLEWTAQNSQLDALLIPPLTAVRPCVPPLLPPFYHSLRIRNTMNLAIFLLNVWMERDFLRPPVPSLRWQLFETKECSKPFQYIQQKWQNGSLSSFSWTALTFSAVESPHLFLKDTWKQDLLASERRYFSFIFSLTPHHPTDHPHRSHVLDIYREKIRRLDWKQPNPSNPFIPVVHGTGLKAALSISSTGFTTLSSLDDGYYGSGFSPSLLITFHSSYRRNVFFHKRSLLDALLLQSGESNSPRLHCCPRFIRNYQFFLSSSSSHR